MKITIKCCLPVIKATLIEVSCWAVQFLGWKLAFLVRILAFSDYPMVLIQLSFWFPEHAGNLFLVIRSSMKILRAYA
jgi:hypothetical protein